MPVASGLSSPLLFDRGVEDSITANGYYVYQTNFSLGTYVGGGFGRFNLVDNALLNPSAPRGNYGVQGMAGLTFAFSPSMVLGLEYRYSETLPSSAAATTTPDGEQDESVTLRFDFLLN
jgi:opacity protein-like surface antigen